MGEHGQGTSVPIQSTRKDGSTRHRIRIAVTMADGRRVWRTARTPREADRLRRELVDARESDLDPSRQTLAVWLRLWIASLRRARPQRHSPRTLDGYEMIVERHIIPALGTLPLTKVTERRIQAWLDDTGSSPRTVHHHRAVLRAALNRAVRQRLIAHNPAAGRSIEMPDAAWHGAQPLTFDEGRRLLLSSEGSPYHAFWRLALMTGLRVGELMGLTWDDIDGTTITVRGQLQRRKGGWVRAPTKAARTLDAISIDEETAAVLARHRERLTLERRPEWRYFGHVFINERGEPYVHRTLLEAFRRACDAAGIPRRRLHDLRHANNELMKVQGIPEDVRMARHGHATTTMDRHYGKPSREQDRAAVEALAAGLR